MISSVDLSFIKIDKMSTRKRLILIDELTESCRLMPDWVQSIFAGLFVGIGILILPVVSYFFLGTIIVVQLMIIILLTKRNIVYRRISKMEVAIKKKIIWIESKRDENEKKKKILINIVLLTIVGFLFYQFTDIKMLIIIGLFWVLFTLKVVFYVPLISVRITKDDNDIEVLLLVDKGTRMNTEIYLYQISSVLVEFNKIEIMTKQDKIEVSLDFRSGKEILKLKNFLRRLNKFEVK